MRRSRSHGLFILPPTTSPITLAAALVLLLGAWPSAGGVRAQAPAGEQKAPLPSAPTVLWHIPKATLSASIAAHGGRLWLGGRYLSMHELRTGKELARVDAREDGDEIGAANKDAVRAKNLERWLRGWQAPVFSGGLVFVRRRSGSLHAFAADLGHELWQVPMEFSHAPGMTSGDIFFAASGEHVTAITGGQVHWRVELGAPVNMTPATDGERVFVGTGSGDVVALDLHTGVEVWRYESDAEFGASAPVVDRGVLYLADRGIPNVRKSAFHAFRAKTGDQLWSTTFGSTGFSRPSVVGDRVWAGFGRSVASFDRATGELDWDGRIATGLNPFGLPSVVGDAVAFGNLDGNFYVHDLETGTLRWRFDARGEDAYVQVHAWRWIDEMLVVSTGAGVFGIAQAEAAKPAPPGFVLRRSSN